MNLGSKAGGPWRRCILAAVPAAVIALAGCGEKSEPDIHPPTTATPTVTTPSPPTSPTTPTQPAPTPTQPAPTATQQ